VVRRAASSTRRTTSNPSAVITVQWCRPLDTASAGGTSRRCA
jgi:hypothetical protein